ncbi:DUF4083 domain-containing protein [Ornithinibacillus massiliensis]|uniref:DUF4083 domain-containing protein n=1 Tax=Ornithinibacillus massiliensis TaxID=1944633 RepID=A0ABS5M9J0_9BACI|nr:DUF4083 domain-containing protein [Ornithinibacillus massiliensis]MBS3678984.1 DUF4083 domain-containing protein [Ornithinibacillus massiliensis]
MDGFHIGDMIFQLAFIAFIILTSMVLIIFFRSSRKRKKQLNQLAEKVDALQSKLEK